MTKLETITRITQGFEGGISFHDPVIIELPYFAESFYCFALKVINGDLWLMDREGEWQGPLKETQVNSGKVINAIYNRVKILIREAA